MLRGMLGQAQACLGSIGQGWASLGMFGKCLLGFVVVWASSRGYAQDVKLVQASHGLASQPWSEIVHNTLIFGGLA